MDDADEKLYDMTRGLVEGMGYSLLDVEGVAERGRRVLRFYIDRAGGVSLGDCEAVSRELAYLLDAEPDFDSGYVLEVSSPGLEHRLKKEREYVHFSGRRARIVLRRPIEGNNVVSGVIAGASGGTVRIALDDGGELSVRIADISRARLLLEGQ